MVVCLSVCPSHTFTNKEPRVGIGVMSEFQDIVRRVTNAHQQALRGVTNVSK